MEMAMEQLIDSLREIAQNTRSIAKNLCVLDGISARLEQIEAHVKDLTNEMIHNEGRLG